MKNGKIQKNSKKFSKNFRTIFCIVQSSAQRMSLSVLQRCATHHDNDASQRVIAFPFVFSRMICALPLHRARQRIVNRMVEFLHASHIAIGAHRAPRHHSPGEKFGKFFTKGLDEKNEIIKIYKHTVVTRLPTANRNVANGK